MAVLTVNFRNWKLSSSKPALEYAEYVCSVVIVTSYLTNRVLPLQFPLFWTKFVGKSLRGDNFILMKKIRSSRKNTTCFFKIQLFPDLSYGHMGGMQLRTNFAAESRVVTLSCGDCTISKETNCVAYNLTRVWRITFQSQRPLRQLLTTGLRQLFAWFASFWQRVCGNFFCLIRRTHRAAVQSMWPLLLKRYQSKM